MGDRLEGRRPRRDPPRPRHLRGLRRLRRAGPRPRPRGRARPRAAGRARPPVGHDPPAVLHHAARRHHRLRREPAEEVPGHLPDQLRQRPDRHLPRGAPRRQALDEPRRPDLPRRQPAHQAGGVLGVAAQGDPPHRPRRALPLRGVHPPGDDARPRRGRLPPELHLLHLAHRQVGDRGVPPRGLPRVRPPMRPNFFVNTPDILHAYLQYGGPAAFKIRAAIAATGSPSWGVYAGYELFEHVAVTPGQRGVPRLGEVPDPDPRLGRRRRRGPHAGAVPHPAQRDPPRAPRAAAAAQHRRSTAATTRTSWSSPRQPPCPTGRATP